MPTEELFRDDAYLKYCDATVTLVAGRSVFVDRTVCYPLGGGQPGDFGTLTLVDGSRARIEDTRKSDNGDIEHVLADGDPLPAAGDRVRLDMFYIRSYSIWKDVEILLRTLPAVWRGTGAY